MNVKVLVVDDNQSLRQGVRLLLNDSRPDWEVCGEGASGEEAIAALTTLHPNILLIDVSMPGMSGIETTRRIRELGLKTHVIIMTVHDVETFATEARSAGADGCVAKSQANRDLVQAIESVLSGGTFFP